ncbi:MAG: Holliday junction resolvase RuvX [Chloroflexi bacterium]|nr:Holliday junction resolvase RuvX [Chloroflexota bacterium]
MTGRILAVDPGEKRIGIAISDSTAAIARPLTILQHTSRSLDAATIAAIAAEHQVVRVIVGQSVDDDGQPNASGRRAARLAGALRAQTGLPVELWNEDFSTVSARAGRQMSGARRSQRAKPLDDLAAAAILQDYLDHLRLDTK